MANKKWLKHVNSYKLLYRAPLAVLQNWLKPPVSNLCVCLLPYLGWLNGSGSLGSISFVFCCLVHLYQHHVSNELPVLGLVFPYQGHCRPHHLHHRKDSRHKGCHHWVVPYENLVVIKYMEIFDLKVTFLKLNMFQRGHFFLAFNLIIFLLPLWCNLCHLSHG